MKYLAFTWPDLQLLHTDVPLRDVSLESSENGVPYLEAALDEATAFDHVTVEGSHAIVGGHIRPGATEPLIREQGTLLIPVPKGPQRGEVQLISYVVKSAQRDYVAQDTVRILAEGIEGLPYGTPWDGPEKAYIEEDPLQIHREIWEHLTSFDDMPHIEIQPAESPVTVGEEEREVSFTDADGNEVDFTAGPYRLRPWAEHDLGRVVEDLATRAPFAHRVVTFLDFGTENHRPVAVPRFLLQRAYPGFESGEPGNLHFEVGHNVALPEEDDDELRDYYSHVIVWGNGDGSRRRRGEAHRPGHNRGRRVLVVEEQGLTTNEACREHARALLGISEQERFYDSITVRDSKAAPFGSFGLGDIIRVKTPQIDGRTHVQRARITAISRAIGAQTMTLSLTEP